MMPILPKPASAALASLALLASCSRPAPPPGPELGSLMVDIGRRFEVCGRAGAAGRFELAAFEADEIEGLFRYEVPGAQLPHEGPVAQIPVVARAPSPTRFQRSSS